MKSFAELPQTAVRCGSSSCSKTPWSSWQVIQSQSSDSCMLAAAAPPIKAGDLSGACVRPVGELWPHKYASDTFAVPVIESQANLPSNAHDSESSALCIWILVIPKPSGVIATPHGTWFHFVIAAHGKQPHCCTLFFPLTPTKISFLTAGCLLKPCGTSSVNYAVNSVA